MTNFYSITILTLLIVTIFTGYNMVGNYIYDNNNLDDKSLEIINNTRTNLEQDFNSAKFKQDELAISENTSFDNVDAFSREYLEEQSEAQTNTNIYKNFKNIPTLIKESIGIPDNVINPFWSIVTIIVSIILIVVGFRLFFGGGKMTKR